MIAFPTDLYSDLSIYRYVYMYACMYIILRSISWSI